MFSVSRLPNKVPSLSQHLVLHFTDLSFGKQSEFELGNILGFATELGTPS